MSGPIIKWLLLYLSWLQRCTRWNWGGSWIQNQLFYSLVANHCCASSAGPLSKRLRGKQSGPRPDCYYMSSLICVGAVRFGSTLFVCMLKLGCDVSNNMKMTTLADDTLCTLFRWRQRIYCYFMINDALLHWKVFSIGCHSLLDKHLHNMSNQHFAVVKFVGHWSKGLSDFIFYTPTTTSK